MTIQTKDQERMTSTLVMDPGTGHPVLWMAMISNEPAPIAVSVGHLKFLISGEADSL
ncbi:MAG: hypothetical protein HQL99_12470 [Magnetococcales bacterium]|nr:hypothetical protein [Magnetococcales bacterium]